MFKELFCRHKNLIEKARFYKVEKIKSVFFNNYFEWNMSAYKLFSCNKCNKEIKKLVFSKNYWFDNDIDYRISRLKEMNYIPYDDYVLI